MNTETINQFDVMNIEALATVEGGYSGKDCLKDMGGYMLIGAGSGALWGAPAGGIGALPGAIVGAHVGAIGGGFACMGGMIGNRFN
ncbi:TPA: Blp family class II bacteriocin [Streptococcus equi subsp. zooepidemicus]|uniref:Blp family class II bacteriocin n=1 Tax=Streptococcus equi TaxID=1336 RepID=UPI00197EFBA6|nr:Blp family class II bacteriocin [Streptococcus equi]MCD3408011.1 Blp family class II bacteriocin [Streptococcus equi subsp. zooepidemicus]MDI5900821.1 Blp family class II bacteriocin [Streptococcus equi subsp. zooepidemicus]MDI5946660.1 Blp family class II bacteriocin [Streptococcus equi subsp. zooepidemicus]MDI5958338.1 Blp family class II bacteriocin [Streptococcus equi subsp. zooepidemicus]MDI5960083.1 Blp family class II bacteriocin [Streptococcus equi subsp. zooepidemicus]